MNFEKMNENAIHCTKKGLCSNSDFPKEMQFMKSIWVFGTMINKKTAVYFKKGYFD
jgi:hypothetical protein